MKPITDGSDLEGVEKAEDILYLKIIRISMWMIDAWPKGPKDKWTLGYFMVGYELFILIPGIIYIRNNAGKLSSFEMGHTYITVFMNTISFTRSVLIVSDKYNKLLFYYLNEIHLFNYRKKSEYSFKIHILIHKISHFFTFYILFLMCVGILLFNLTPLYNSYLVGMFRTVRPENATFDPAIYYEMPFNYKTSMRGYIILFVINWYVSITCSLYFCVVDLTISLLVFHLWGHMRILTYNLENFPKPASLLVETREDRDDTKAHMYTELELKEVHSLLRENIAYHRIIIDFQARMSDTYGEILVFYFLFHQVCECLLMLECSQMDRPALLRYGPLTVVIFQQLIQLSIIFELLGSSNDKLIDAVYSVPWEFMDTKNRKLVFFMLKNSQRSMNLKAMNVLTIGVQTMITILKTSFSYFVMLRTVADEET